MTNSINESIFKNIDSIIEKVNSYQNEDFREEIEKRQNLKVKPFSNKNDILKTLSQLIAFSQNANSKSVEKVIESQALDSAFENFDIEKVIKLNPCDIADNHWEEIKGIRQQAKLFHIVSLARKIHKLDAFDTFFDDNQIPKEIKSIYDLNIFWSEFNQLLSTFKKNSIPFFQSTTSLLHLLLVRGYDCVKPDLVVMKVAKKLNIVANEKGDKNLRQAVKTIQEYYISRKVKPAIVDLYFLIEGGQQLAKKYVKPDFYNNI